MKRYMTFKRGSTFEYNQLILAADDDEIDNLLLENISSQIRTDNDDVIVDLLVTETSVLGTYKLSYVDTSDWPLENLYFDVRYILNDKICFTDTIMIKMVKQQTVPEPEIPN